MKHFDIPGRQNKGWLGTCIVGLHGKPSEGTSSLGYNCTLSIHNLFVEYCVKRDTVTY